MKGGKLHAWKILNEIKFSKYINYLTNMCWNGQGTMILFIKRLYTRKHIMIVKAFIIDIGHGLNGNKFMKPGIFMPHHFNVYSLKQKEYIFV